MTIDEFNSGSERLKLEFEALAKELGRHFTRSEAAKTAGDYLRALLSGVERKTSWQMSEAEGRATPYAFQHLLGRALWDVEAVLRRHQQRVKAALGDRGVLILDETGFLKKGDRSAGVARQHSGTAGRIENSQIGVFAAWATEEGHTLIDRGLHLPAAWVEDGERRRAAGIPEETVFRTKPCMARDMVDRALRAGFRPDWITADEAYGHDGKFRLWLEEMRQPYVFAVPSNERAAPGGEKMKVGSLRPGTWRAISAGTGSKGPRIYDWAWMEVDHPYEGTWARRVLMRRGVSDPADISYYFIFCHKAAKLEKAVEAAGSRWRIEECFESAKGEVGLDHYEVRSWTGWHRHITLSMMAHAALVAARAKVFPAAEAPEKPGKPSSMTEFKKKRRERSG